MSGANRKLLNSKLPPAGTIPLRVTVKTFLADTCTPVSLYLRLRDKFPGAVLLESSDNAEGRNSRSFIAVKPSAEIIATGGKLKAHVSSLEIFFEQEALKENVATVLNDFLSLFRFTEKVPAEAVTGLIGYMGYDAVRFFEDVNPEKITDEIPVLRFALYKTIIVFDHFRQTMHVVEQLLPGEESGISEIETLITHRDVPQYRFHAGEETSNMTDDDYLKMVEQGKAHCHRGDVFQVVLSRNFSRRFSGDEFNVYRALRAINPSPYLFFADYGDYRIFGSSPEAQLVVRDSRAVVHPIAGTFRKTGDEDRDRELEAQLLNDPKENAEHVMLVDLARNDLSRRASDVRVENFREVHRFSHVIHLVSKVSGEIKQDANLFELLGKTFPAGTLSGAPKIKAMELIGKYEPTARGWYGGCIGLIGFDQAMNMAIMIRSFFSRNAKLSYQAGAGIVAASEPEKELQEIRNKLEALNKAIAMAETISN